MSSFLEFRHEQARQATDADQVYETWKNAYRVYEDRYTGSMFWRTINGKDHLYRKPKRRQIYVGPRSEETEAAFERFQAERGPAKERLSSLGRRLEEMAPVTRAMKLGRLPRTAGRILRTLEREGTVGTKIDVVGTNALFVYERMAGVRIDVDLLQDARTRITLMEIGMERPEIMSMLRKADRSFEPMTPNGYRAVNGEGYMVDLVTPLQRDMRRTDGRRSVGTAQDDLHAIEIEGLIWLVNSPKVSAVVFDQTGFPLEFTAPDPRAFALHKLWLSKREDREPQKRRRDAAQADLVASLVRDHLQHLKFDADDLKAIPMALFEQPEVENWMAPLEEEAGQEFRIEPRW